MVSSKMMYRIVMILMLLFLVSGFVTADTPWLHVDGNKIKDPSGNVVVLRGISLIDLGAQENYYGDMKVRDVIDLITNKNDSSGNSPGWS